MACNTDYYVKDAYCLQHLSFRPQAENNACCEQHIHYTSCIPNTRKTIKDLHGGLWPLKVTCTVTI